ncbi:MAG: AAA family ATPase [Hamadaea sp.]|nr:adenylate/guanylate cyclase domain-containing protein [Hamadaea sp.]NUR72601.1 AAA family ATPase [Hamadaea sp.]NUT23104.1 AAA family ATPase [Hamadaea sp.]
MESVSLQHGFAGPGLSRILDTPSLEKTISLTCPTCSRAAGPEDKFCGGCGVSLAVFCLQCGRQAAPQAAYCTGCGTRLGAPPTAPREDRRMVTVLFVDMVDFTPFAEQLDPEQVRGTQHEYFSVVRRVVRQHGGVLEKYIGDAVMAIFGAPVATENDALRAVRAGLEVQRALTQQAGPVADLSFRVGVATGQALVDVTAARDGGQAIVAGDVVNTAARLQAACPPAGVLVDELTYDATHGEIEYATQPPAQLKGKRSLSHVWLATAAGRLRVGERDESTPMVDRDHERGMLTTALHRMIADRAPQLVTIFGVAGIGKSRLLRELSRYAARLPGQHIRWLVGHCPPFGENVTYAALAEIVKAEVGVLDTDDDETARERLSAALFRLGGDGEADRLADAMGPLLGLAGSRLPQSETESAWRRFLQLLAASGPTVLLFEDMHWADEAMLRFVEMLCGAGKGLPLMVVATARPELRERHPSWTSAITGAISISLGPMRDTDISTMYAQMFGQATFATASLDPLVELAGGNPLYAHEYVRMLVDRGELRPVGPSWMLESDAATPMPQTVQAVIANRLDLLEPTDRAVLQAAAVVGTQFWPGAIAAASGLAIEPVIRALHRLEQRDLVVEVASSTMADEPEYAFRHVLVRDVCYQRLPRSERVHCHQRTADWLDRTTDGRLQDVAEVLANHRWAAHEITRTLGQDPAPFARAARDALQLAARRAYTLHALETAQTLMGRALGLKLDPDPGLELLAAEIDFYRDGDAFLNAGGVERLIRLTEQLAEAGDVAGAARGCTLLGQAAWSRADRAETLHWLGRAVGYFEGLPDSPHMMEALLELARARMMDFEFEPAIAAARGAADAARSLRLAEAEASARITIETARYMAGDADALDELHRVTDDCRRAKLSNWRRAASNLAWAYLEEGDVAANLRLLSEVRASVRGGGHALSPSYNEQAQSSYMAGDWPSAIGATAVVMHRPTEEWDLHAIAIGAWMRVLRGEPVENDGEDPIETVLTGARRSGFHRVLRSTLAHAALCRVLQLRTGEAQALLDELDRDWSQTEMMAFGEWVASAAHAAALLGPEASRKAQTMFERSTRRTPWVEAALSTVAGALADDAAEAGGHYLAAAALYAKIGTPSDEVLALSAALRVLPARDHRRPEVEQQVRAFAERNGAPKLLP